MRLLVFFFLKRRGRLCLLLREVLASFCREFYRLIPSLANALTQLTYEKQGPKVIPFGNANVQVPTPATSYSRYTRFRHGFLGLGQKIKNRGDFCGIEAENSPYSGADRGCGNGNGNGDAGKLRGSSPVRRKGGMVEMGWGG